jgi:transposase-like protein
VGKLLEVNEKEIQERLNQGVVGTVEQTINQLLEAEADRLCQAKRYERTEARKDTRAGHYERKLGTKGGEVTLQVPKLRTLPFETAIIAR